jgi:hypothetical protein
MAATARIPAISSVENAIKIYYKSIEIGNKEIKALFAPIGACKALALKQLAKAYADEHGAPVWNASKVNTEMAFEAWGLNIEDLEKRYNKLKRMGMIV